MVCSLFSHLAWNWIYNLSVEQIIFTVMPWLVWSYGIYLILLSISIIFEICLWTNLRIGSVCHSLWLRLVSVLLTYMEGEYCIHNNWYMCSIAGSNNYTKVHVVLNTGNYWGSDYLTVSLYIVLLIAVQFICLSDLYLLYLNFTKLSFSEK